MESKENVKAQAILSDEAVHAALTADQGKDAKLDAWESVPFTKKGDNYASYVTGINVNYTKGGKKEKASYVVKLNPCRPPFSEDIPDFSPLVFRKEGKFYTELLPELNLLIAQSGQNTLPFPKCYYTQFTEEKEMIIFEDLRIKGFKMTDRRKGMDLQHALLVMQGLGRLHAASVLMQKKISIDDIKSKYPWLFEELWEGKILELMMSESLKTSIKMLENIGGHEKAIDWHKKIVPNIVEFFANNLAITQPFSVVCHGDCWNNNILFRYNDSGIPVEVMLLDVQVNKLASPATDLNHFMFASLVGDVRKPNVDQMLTEYFDNFSSVIQGCSQDLPYTKEELVKEYKSKREYGLLFGSMIVPPIVMEGEEIPDMENIKPGDFEQFMADWQKLVLESVDKNPFCKPRFVAMFDEMLEEGIFS